MDDVNNIVEQVKLATNIQLNKKILREKILADLHMTHNGGLFKLDPSLLAFVSTWPNDELFLEDVYQNPIKINRNEFVVAAQQHYQKVMNRWHDEYQSIKTIRKI